MASTKKDKAVRTVRNPGRAKRKLWAYGYAEIAAYLGATEAAVRLAVYEKRLDPSSLESLHAAKLRGSRALYAVKSEGPNATSELVLGGELKDAGTPAG